MMRGMSNVMSYWYPMGYKLCVLNMHNWMSDVVYYPDC